MCGSGTFLIEAAMHAFNIPPRILRESYSFKNWNDFDEPLWTRINKEEKNSIEVNLEELRRKVEILNPAVIDNVQTLNDKKQMGNPIKKST